MKSSRTNGIYLAVLLATILILAFFAVRSTNHPGECETGTGTYPETQQHQEAETIWCPSTWEPVTTFTCFLVISTAGLWAFTAMLWYTTRSAVIDGEKAILAAQTSAKIAMDAFILEHRARIIVRNMKFANHVFDGTESVLRFYCVNVGETACTITEVVAFFGGIQTGRRIPHDINTYACNLGKTFLNPSEFCVAEIDCHPILDAQDRARMNGGGEELLCVGTVLYKDQHGILRRTGFARFYDVTFRRFDPMDDEEFEYQY